ncbi:hypothetical protein NDU88_004665 [Pleurodeles waltl]|uniref:Uncharacterized protein n=1 Tax=Pleurodeles waltl TaxID=8319 RepID=A0AAV7SJK3_PLEWA|nr:hypothetical protein NDU88_004665 [Pleurodeles waltl]
MGCGRRGLGLLRRRRARSVTERPCKAWGGPARPGETVFEHWASRGPTGVVGLGTLELLQNRGKEKLGGTARLAVVLVLAGGGAVWRGPPTLGTCGSGLGWRVPGIGDGVVGLPGSVCGGLRRQSGEKCSDELE